MAKKINCPSCGKQNTWTSTNPFKPFCCERCKLIDLGSWADEKYRVVGNAANANASTDENDDNEKH